MGKYPLDAKDVAQAIIARREKGSGTPSAYGDCAEAWQAGYRMGLGDATAVVAELVTNPAPAHASASNDRYEKGE